METKELARLVNNALGQEYVASRLPEHPGTMFVWRNDGAVSNQSIATIFHTETDENLVKIDYYGLPHNCDAKLAIQRVAKQFHYAGLTVTGEEIETYGFC